MDIRRDVKNEGDRGHKMYICNTMGHFIPLLFFAFVTGDINGHIVKIEQMFLF